MRSPPLRWRVFVLLAGLAALLIVDAVLAAQTNFRLESEQRIVSELRPIEEVPERLLFGLEAQQNSVRGFALTGDPELLAGYAGHQRVEGRAARTLRDQLRGRPDLMARLDDVLATAQEWHRTVAEPVIRAIREGDRQEAVRLVSNIDDPLFDRLRADTTALARAIDAQLRTRQRAAAATGERLLQQLVVSSVLGIGLVLVSGLLIRRWLTRPVTQLSRDVRLVADGHLEKPIAGTGPVEFLQLGDDIEVMRRRILDELADTKRAVEGLEQNAPLVLLLRSQLVSTPASLPAGLQMATRFEPAEGVLAGDWMATIRLDRDRLGVIVLDVSGHGPEAGLRALWLKHLLLPALHLELEPADALHWVAGQIGDTGEWFATCVIVEIDASTGKCRYANAGHPAPLVLRSGGVARMRATGTLFGALPGQHWETAEVTIGRSDLLVVYTDGITETRNEAGDEFGDNRLISCFRMAAERDPGRLADRVMDMVHAFGSERLKDDATLALVTVAPTRGERARDVLDPHTVSP
jgi:serine phosphatase RsbU (regulator of sigma subunit)/CHASE3 domain sensor protein